MTPNFFQGAHLKKIWVDFTGQILQGRFYRVPFKSILRVQIKQAIIWFLRPLFLKNFDRNFVGILQEFIASANISQICIEIIKTIQ